MPAYPTHRRPHRQRHAVRIALIPIVALLATACGVTSAPTGGDPTAGSDVPRGRIPVDMAVSSEKVTLLTDLARTFNDNKDASSFTAADGKSKRAFVRVRSKSSGGAAQALSNGWDETADGPRPVVWSPAASSWGAIVNQRLANKGEPAVAPPSKPFMRTPLVIAMPKPMAEALGYPAKPIGWADIIALSKDPEGWGGKGNPLWGKFKLGKTNPNFSTSGLSATIAQYYAAVGKTDGLSQEDLAKPTVTAFARDVESSVVHYGDITMTFLNNWFRADQRGTSLQYVSAVAVEEKSVIDYNLGNPDGIIDPGETPRKPRIPLVAVYPREGTLFSDNPYIILDAPWVTEDQKAAARGFQEFVSTPENQRRVLEFGFRPGNPAVSLSAPIVAANGVDPQQPQTTLQVPEPDVLLTILDAWAKNRKGARVLLVMDISGSMGDPGSDGETKLDLAKRAAAAALREFKADDQVGLRVFSTDVDGAGKDYLDLVPIGPIAATRERMTAEIGKLFPTNGTPLYTAAGDSYEFMKTSYDPTRINAVVLLTDGQNEDPRNDRFDQLLATLRSGSEGEQRSVRIFSIAYGDGADKDTLRRIAETTQASAYDASNPRTIEQVFINVVSNF